jgi:ParB-like chromosome segregation protein Spo0J
MADGFSQQNTRRKKVQNKLREAIEALSFLDTLETDQRVEAINEIREAIHVKSPFVTEPVDFVRWVKNTVVEANDYNPNSVAPPEMELLRLSIAADGYTQPIVTNKEDDKCVVVDGFHRNRVGKECKDVTARVHGYLPVVQIRSAQTDKTDRIASTIRHNRARGKHRVEAMSDIVIELKKRNWTDERISKNLGMDKDEILRLCQIAGLAEVFQDQEFSKAWDVEGEITEADFVELSEETIDFGEVNTRTVNTNDPRRIFHTYELWECHKAGFYNSSKPGMTKSECEEAYRKFLADIPRFSVALDRVIVEWKNSCEHYLTNTSMNRIAWLGQAACCIDTGIPSEFRAGFFLLTEAEQVAANETALIYLNKWLTANGREPVTMEDAYSYERQSDIY